jgi:hypothetical protein
MPQQTEMTMRKLILPAWEELGNLEQAGLLQSEGAPGIRYSILSFPFYPELNSSLPGIARIWTCLHAPAAID